MKPITVSRWRSSAAQQRAKSARVIASFGEIRRDKPRDATEAAFLRRVGTPERLIGPKR